MRDRSLIRPFEPGRAKEVAGKQVVSHGSSSYGCEIRCPSEFKTFTST